MHTTYIVKCKDGTLYTGYTNNMSRRIKQHNGEIVGGAKYTKGRGPVTLVYKEEYTDESVARKREVEIKRLTRTEKVELIASA